MDEGRTMEEAYATGTANVLVENNLSKVKIIHNSKGTTWEISVKHEDVTKAANAAKLVDDDLRRIYASK